MNPHVFSGFSNSSFSTHYSQSQSLCFGQLYFWLFSNTNHSLYYLISSWNGHFILLKSYPSFKMQPKSYLEPFLIAFLSNTNSQLCSLILFLNEKCSHFCTFSMALFMMPVCVLTFTFPSYLKVNLCLVCLIIPGSMLFHRINA